MRTGIMTPALLAILTLGLVGPRASVSAQEVTQIKYKATVQAVKPDVLAKAKTYMWIAGRPSYNKDIDKLIVAAVDRELAARGFAKAAAAPSDLTVNYSSLSRTDTNVKGKPAANGAYPVLTVGTLVVDLQTPSNKQSAFRARIDAPIEAASDKLEAAINEAVKDLFEKYPAPKAAK
jgi:hypothetical protein